jgi:hypothetical protein
VTTTPDSRIRADWTLPAETAAPPPTPIDTSTTAGKIRVMDAYDRGEAVQAFHRQGKQWGSRLIRNEACKDPTWDWSVYDYRIAPSTALQAARTYDRSVPPSGSEADNNLRDLLKQIDSCVTMTVHGDGHLKQVHMGLGAMQPGRYRLVRDDD